MRAVERVMEARMECECWSDGVSSGSGGVVEWWSGAVFGGDHPFLLAALKDRGRVRAREGGRQGADALATTCKVERYNVVESATFGGQRICLLNEISLKVWTVVLCGQDHRVFSPDVIAHRTKTLIVAALAIAALSIFIVVKRRNFDSEVLNLLPSKFESVVGLKEFNNQFAQARQLVFGFLGEKGHAEDVDAFKTHFIEELGKQPWVLRTFDRIPLETQEGLSEIQGIVAVAFAEFASGRIQGCDGSARASNDR